MSRLLLNLVSERRRRATGLAAFVLTFLLVFATTAGLATRSILTSLDGIAGAALPELIRLRTNALAALDQLDATVTAPSCSAAFLRQVGRVAFAPDGLNEFLLVGEGDRILCTSSIDRYAEPPVLPAPDLEAGTDGVSYWRVRRLGFLDLQGLEGAILRRGRFAVVLPASDSLPTPPPWLSMEAGLATPDGRWLHTGGTWGLRRPPAAGRWDTTDLPRDVRVSSTVCDVTGVHCLVAVASLRGLLKERTGVVLLALPFAFLAAFFVRNRVTAWIDARWSFETRFARSLGPDTVVCAYQPVMDLANGAIVGCEVLARWRDADGTIVMPDRFLPVVEAMGATLRFTALVVERAVADLSAADLPRPFRVAVNVFPQDLAAGGLAPLFRPLLDDPRFRPVIELVETQEIDLARAAPEVESLRRSGLEVFIDDFGTGYFSVQTLVDLDVDGVKLDRAFAMAPAGSVLARMMPLAIEMVQATGRIIVVEGVETAERLAQLSAMRPRVHLAQGYFISRPVDVAGLERRAARAVSEAA